MKHFIQFSSVIIVAAMLLFPNFALFAQEHHHEAPHGGTVITVDKYHLELVVEDSTQTAHIYLLDKVVFVHRYHRSAVRRFMVMFLGK